MRLAMFVPLPTLLFSVLTCSLSCSAPALEAANPRAEPIALAALRGQPYLKFTVRDGLGRDVTAYVSEPSDAGPDLPLAVYVQGSGCGSHFARTGNGWVPRNGHMGLLEATAGRFRVLIVEKPGVAARRRSANGRGLRGERSLPARAHAGALDGGAAGGDRRRAHAARDRPLTLAGRGPLRRWSSWRAGWRAMLPEVTHVAVLAGGGPSQLADLTALVRRGRFLGHVSSDPEARVAALRTTWEDILAHPDDPNRLFLGHAYPRWASFLSSSPMQELSEVRWARVLVAQGLADDAVEPFTADVLTATLRVQGIDVTEMLLPGADHSFALRGDPGRDGWREMLGQVADWAVL